MAMKKHMESPGTVGTTAAQDLVFMLNRFRVVTDPPLKPGSAVRWIGGKAQTRFGAVLANAGQWYLIQEDATGHFIWVRGRLLLAQTDRLRGENE